MLQAGGRVPLKPKGQKLGLLAAVANATAGSSPKVVAVLVHGRPPPPRALQRPSSGLRSPLGCLLHTCCMGAWGLAAGGGTALWTCCWEVCRQAVCWPKPGRPQQDTPTRQLRHGPSPTRQWPGVIVSGMEIKPLSGLCPLLDMASATRHPITQQCRCTHRQLQ